MTSPAIVPYKQPKSQQNWLGAIGSAITAAEAAELDLSRKGGIDPAEQRKASGSYYTPSDVAAHFWDLFFRHHQIFDLRSLLNFVATNDLVEPSAGSGMFVFSFFHKAASLGATPEQLAGVRFHVVDINLAALRFFSEELRKLEGAVGVRFEGIGPSQSDFLQWVRTSAVPNAIFVGNPPFVANSRGARWRNLYADFVEEMLAYKGTKGLSLILPLSVCFSRDYADLRATIRSKNMGISASSYDNIPDCLFKSGKPDSKNSNKANSQRCTILNIGGPNSKLRESSPLLKWPAADRATVLGTIPSFYVFSDDDASGQIPRPASKNLAEYLRSAAGAKPLRTFLSKVGKPVFAVGGVSRNFIGIRDYSVGTGIIPIRLANQNERGIVLQILSSELFYEYWRTYGDGFHVTVDLIERFPVTAALLEAFRINQSAADQIWADRATYAKEKLNSGHVIRSYDFRSAFEVLPAEIA